MKYYPNQQSPYGTIPEMAGQAPHHHLPKKRVTVFSVMTLLFAPFKIFSVGNFVMSFSVHYHQPPIALAVVCGSFLMVLFIGWQAMKAFRRDASGAPRDATWYAFLFVSMLCGWAAGIVMGDLNFFRNMEPFYEVHSLHVYEGIEPATTRGQRLMDAGQVEFARGSHLDLRRSIGFKNVDTYCVAPIVSNGTKGWHGSYDFWAVGVNCCHGGRPDFECGEYGNKKARSGLRVMRPELRVFFHLAVKQAESAYGIKAVHPMFFYWMEDPGKEEKAYQTKGEKDFFLGMCEHFAVQLFAVVGYVAVASRMGPIPL